MNRKATWCAVAVLVAALAGAVTVGVAEEPKDNYWDPTGIGTHKTAFGDWITSIWPADNSGKTYFIFSESPQLDNNATDWHGHLVRIDSRSFHYTALSLVTNDTGQLMARIVAAGTWSLDDNDQIRAEFWLATYAPWQDPNSGEPPLFGCSGPYSGSGSGVVMGVIPPCGNS